MPDPQSEDIDERLSDMLESIQEFGARCHNNSAFQLANDAVRLARREQRLIPLLNAQFQVVNQAQALFQAHRGRETAIEMIALLESPDRARQVQADFDENEYAETRAWMTACAYDNLATHTGEISGFNSEGMHQCIADGIAVCRRTGKMQCIACFREYASDVHLASDDLEMALHQVSLVASLGDHDPGSDRRWSGANKQGRILAMMGDLQAAKAAFVSALKFARGYHDPLSARLHTSTLLESVLWLAGESDAIPKLVKIPKSNKKKPAAHDLPPGENLSQDIRCDYRDAVAACCQGEYEQAIELLTKWDTRLGQDNLSHEWFETRLRLIAAHRLAGKQDKVDRLVQPLQKRANAARDWITVRRLRQLIDSGDRPTPTAMLTPPRMGPFASQSVALVGDPPETQPASETASASIASEDLPPPMNDLYQQMRQRLRSNDEENPEADILRQILAIVPTAISDPRDAAGFLHLLPYVVGEAAPYDEIWNWAEQAAAPFQRTSYVVNLLATLADALRHRPDSNFGERIAVAQVETMFRQSLELDSDSPLNHARAGVFYLHQDNLGEAERCLARAFRLQRYNGNTALQLADVYERTERPREALNVLDLCLREGCDDPNLAWEAVLTAYRTEQFESMLTYLDRYESLLPDQPWVGHFRAIGHLEQGQPKLALEALALEEQRSPQRPFGIEVLRACAAAALQLPDTVRQHLASVLAVSWSTIDYFTLAGMNNLSIRLWNAIACLPPDDQLVMQLRNRLIRAGLAPNSLFALRSKNKKQTDNTNYYRCSILQPLDERWAESPGCLAGQAGWSSYRGTWGVLAHDEDSAVRLVLSAQAECYELEAAVEEVEQLDENYKDAPKIVWQGPRWTDADED